MRKLFFYLSLFLIVMSNLSFQWPVKNYRLTSTYGESRADHFHDGVDIISSKDEIYPVKSGFVIYEWSKAFFPLENYWGGGNYKIIQHKDGLMSFYMHLSNEYFSNKEVDEKSVIGTIGNTGHSYGGHLHFTIFDPKNGTTINPLLLLPAIIDKKSPELFGLLFKIDDKYIRVKNKSEIRLTKHYPLLIDLNDTIKGNERLGVYKIKIKINNKTVYSREYDKLVNSSRGMLNDEKTFFDHFDEKGYYKVNDIKYKNGVNIIEIFASDYNGNNIEERIELDINLDL